ncbi:uncharacterized protein LOC131433189 [Malaya genurostris]|uniref:uncharacterized protein LOC131433189 n=1 Tax=Malaya genurostris TaxID=325434 RepID=UPI0026F3C1B9|nr:uncharacterized protein LOC131433189 [Malaya genurostris]
MNDYLQNILHSDLSDLKKEFPLFDTDTFDLPRRGKRNGRPLQLADPNDPYSKSTRDLNVIQLEPISIKSEKGSPQVVNVKQTFRFPNNFITKKNSYHSHSHGRRSLIPRNMYSQTSKTIVELYEAQRCGAAGEPRTVLSHQKSELIDSDINSETRSDVCVKANIRNGSYTMVGSDFAKKNHHKQGAKPVELILIKPKNHRTVVPTTPYFNAKKKRPVSKRKYTRNFPVPVKSPKRKTKYPSIKLESIELDDTAAKDGYQEDTGNSTSECLNPSNEFLDDGVCSTYGTLQVNKIIDKLQDNVWDVNLNGIRELIETASKIDWKKYEKHMTIINRKMIDFLKSPRSSLCRSACQAIGELFREAKSTKRPEFDEIVDILLCKTADSNRFIQKDANAALDKLVTYIPISHSVRALSAHGPVHKNPLVRIATARLLVCICALFGLDAVLGTNANPRTRQAILTIPIKFLTDKNLETRKLGERLYNMLIAWFSARNKSDGDVLQSSLLM